MKLPAPSQSFRIGKLAEIDYGSSGSSPWWTKCLDDKQQCIVCEIRFDGIILSANDTLLQLSPMSPSNKLTLRLMFPCCDGQEQGTPIILADLVSVRVVAQPRWQRALLRRAYRGSSFTLWATRSEHRITEVPGRRKVFVVRVTPFS